ncbi:unnamed protein product [Brassicogethes aeneus]|uniref:Uncharacterized protein n=1 Tax=Brassicogethes aeneus TaxID=1431903 RepID=A0A9P0BDL4_BRAAE|nr:unnamed protein product [Brassicogethes aeneus]
MDHSINLKKPPLPQIENESYEDTEEDEADEDEADGEEDEQHTKKVWLHISRAQKEVTEETVLKHIKVKTKCDENQLSVTLCKETNEQKSFMVGLPFEFHDEVYKSDFWPQEIGYKRFYFGNNRQQKQTFL